MSQFLIKLLQTYTQLLDIFTIISHYLKCQVTCCRLGPTSVFEHVFPQVCNVTFQM